MKLPLVTIVGRPNVGKSTLFNRILKKREAIVDDLPGVTRDRHYAETDWSGKSFMLVDTGGYMPNSEDLMDQAIREQVNIAMDEADVIMMMVDLKTGITDIDIQMAGVLRKTDRPVMLLVNKVDSEAWESEAYQFYNLGLGDPIMISSSEGRRIGDMLDILISHFDTSSSSQEEESIKLAIIGKENVGKSSFVNTLLGEERVIVTPIPGTTRDPIDSPLRYQKRDYLLIDTAGLKRRAKVKENVLFYSQLRTMRSIQRADVVIYLISAADGITRQDLRVITDAVEARRPIVLAVNKWDLIEKNDRTTNEWQRDFDDRLGEFRFIPTMFISVHQKQRMYKLLDLATEVYEEARRKISTSDLNKVLLPIIHQNSPPAVKGSEIKINYITQVKTNPPVFAFFGNKPELITPNYRRFLENQIRNYWTFRGVPIVVVMKSKRKHRA